jgi:hypothetical protein
MATEPQKPKPVVSPEIIEEIFGPDPAKWPAPSSPSAAKIASMMGVYPPPRDDTTGLPRETALDQAARPCGGLAGIVKRLDGDKPETAEPEPIILDGYTLYVELYDNRTHERGSKSEQLTIVDLGDNPALVKLAGTLAEAAHENLKALD